MDLKLIALLGIVLMIVGATALWGPWALLIAGGVLTAFGLLVDGEKLS